MRFTYIKLLVPLFVGRGPRTAFASAMPATVEKYELIFQAFKYSTKDELSTIGINVCVFL